MDDQVTNEMIKNGAMNKLNSLFISQVAIEGQKSQIGFLKPYKKFKNDKSSIIAAELVMHYLISFEFINTIKCINAESSNSQLYDFDSRSTRFDALKVPISDAPIKSLLFEWLKDVSTPFYDNRDRLSEGIMARYSELFKSSSHSSLYSKTEKKDLPPPPNLDSKLTMVFPDKNPPQQQIGLIKAAKQLKNQIPQQKQEKYQYEFAPEKVERYSSRKRPESNYSSILKFSDSDDGDWSPPEQILPRYTESKQKAANQPQKQKNYQYNVKSSRKNDNTISDVFDDMSDF